MELWNDALVPPCEGQSRRRLSPLRLSANTAMLRTACFLCVIGHRELLEAISHFTTGIELLKTLPETPARTQHTITLHLALGAALQMTKGLAAPEVERAYAQARALCQQVGETQELFPVLFGLWRGDRFLPPLP